MDEPNLQTVPKPLDYKVLLTASEAVAAGSDGGQASAHAPRTSNLRAAFVAPPGFVLLSGGCWEAWRVVIGSAHAFLLLPADGMRPGTTWAVC